MSTKTTAASRRLLEILKPQKPEVSSARSDCSAHQIINGFRQDNPTRDTVLLQSSRNIHAVTEHIKFGCYHIAEMHRRATHGARAGDPREGAWPRASRY